MSKFLFLEIHAPNAGGSDPIKTLGYVWVNKESLDCIKTDAERIGYELILKKETERTQFWGFKEKEVAS